MCGMATMYAFNVVKTLRDKKLSPLLDTGTMRKKLANKR